MPCNIKCSPWTCKATFDAFCGLCLYAYGLMRTLRSVLPAEEAMEVVADILGVERRAFNERRRNSDLRGVAVRALCRHVGLTHREAAAVAGMGTGSDAARQVRRIEARLGSDPLLRRRVARIEDTLNRKTNR